MPQLDFTTYLPQIFWLAVIFAVLLVLMAFLALPSVRRALEVRRQRIDDDLSRAATAKSEAEAVAAAYQQRLAAARAEAQAAMAESAQKMSAEAAERQRELAQSLAEEVRAAERRIAAARDEALADIRGVAVEIAGLAAAKVAGIQPDPVAVAKAVDAVAGEIGVGRA
jgi:F-type H+-transporting ATPase subunit b